MSQYSAEFTNNLNQFNSEIDQGLSRFEQRVQKTGQQLNAVNFGAGLGEQFLASFENAARETERQATQLAESISQKLRAARVEGGATKAGRARAFELPAGVESTAAGFGNLGAVGVQKIKDSLEKTLSSLPPEFDAVRPALIAEARGAITSLRDTLRALKATTDAEARESLGRGATPFIGGRSKLPTQSDLAKLGRGIPSGTDADFRAQLGVLKAAYQTKLETITKGALVNEALDPNFPGTTFGPNGSKKFSANTPIYRNGVADSQAIFAGVPDLSEKNSSEQAKVLNAQSLAAAERTAQVAVESADRQTVAYQSAARAAQASRELTDKITQQLASGEATKVTGGAYSRGQFYQGSVNSGFEPNNDPAANLAARQNAEKAINAEVEKQEAAQEKITAELEQRARLETLATAYAQGRIRGLGPGGKPRYYEDPVSGTTYSGTTGLPIDSQIQRNDANALRDTANQRQQRAVQQAEARKNPGLLQAFAGGVVSRGYEAPGTGLASTFGSAGVLTRYGAAGAGVGVLFKGVEELKTGVIDLARDQTELNIVLEGTGVKAKDLTGNFQDLAASGVDINTAYQVGTQALGVYGQEIRNTADATDILNNSIQQSAVLATNAGTSVTEAAKALQEGTQGFGLGSAGQGRLNDAIAASRQNFRGSNPGEVAAALGSSSDAAREAGLSPEQTANILALVNSRTGQSSGSLTSGLDRLISQSGGGTFTQALSTAGIANTGQVGTEIQQLSAYYNNLGSAAQIAFEKQLGGSKSLQFLLPLLRDGGDLTAADAKSANDAGLANETFGKRINDLAGEIKQVGAEFKDLFQLLSQSGLFAGVGVGLELLKQFLTVTNGILSAYNKLPAVLKDSVGLVLELAAGFALLKASRNPDSLIGGVRGRFGKGTGAVEGEVAGAGAVGATAAGSTVAAEGAAIEAAGAESAAAITGAGEAIAAAGAKTAAALDAAAVEIGVAGTEAATAEAGAGAANAAGGLSGLFARGRAGAGAAATGIGNFLGRDVGVGTGALGAAAAAYEVYGLYNANNKINTAQSRAVTLLGNGAGSGSVDDLKNSASQLRTAADNIGKASSGIFGTIEGGIGELYGGANRGKERLLLNRTAGAEEEGANRIAASRTAALNAAASGAPGRREFGAALDVSSTDNLAKSIQNLQERGATAADVMNALTGSLGQLIDSGSGKKLSGRSFLAGQSGVFAADAGVATTSNLISNLQLYKDAGNQRLSDALNGNGKEDINKLAGSLSITGKILGGGKGPLERTSGVANVDQKQLQKDLQSDYNDYFKNTGIDNGGKIDSKKLFAFAEDDLRKRLGFTIKQYQSLDPELRQQLKSASQAGVLDALKNTIGANGGPSQQQVRDIVSQGIKDVPATGQQASIETINSQRGGVPAANAQSGALASANTQVKNIQQLITLTKKAAATAKTDGDRQADTTLLLNLGLQLKSAQNDAVTAATADAQAITALAVASLPENDKIGRLGVQIAAAKAALAKPGQDAGARRQEAATLKDLNNQAYDQTQQNAADTLSAGVDPRNTVGNLAAAAITANKALQSARSGHGTQTVAQALRAKNAADIALLQGTVADTNTRRDANVAVGDQLGAAYAASADAYGVAASDLTGSAQQAADQKTAQEKYLAALQLSTQISNAQSQENIDPRDALAVAQNKQFQDQQTLNVTPQTDKLAVANLLIQLQQDRIAVAQAGVQAASIMQQLGEDVTNPVVVARQAVKDAIAKLGADRSTGADQNTINADLLNVTQQVNAEQKATFDQRLQDTQTQYSLQRESGAAYIQSLRLLRDGIKGNSRQAIDERNQVDAALKSAYGDLSGQFNIGSIKVPSVYEVRRSIATAQTGQGFVDNHVTSITINGIGSTQEVVAIVKQQLGSTAVTKRAPIANRRF